MTWTISSASMGTWMPPSLLMSTLMALPFLRARPRVASGLECVICLDDPTNQLVTDDIGPSQMDKADVCDVRQNILDVGEPATLDGKVSLGGITGDN